MIEKMLVLSTAHLPREEMELLNERIAAGEYDGWVRREGTLVNVLLTSEAEGLQDLPYFKALVEFTPKCKCDWLMFDRDGESLINFRMFDWGTL